MSSPADLNVLLRSSCGDARKADIECVKNLLHIRTRRFLVDFSVYSSGMTYQLSTYCCMKKLCIRGW